jgi:hypothetical protein
VRPCGFGFLGASRRGRGLDGTTRLTRLRSAATPRHASPRGPLLYSTVRCLGCRSSERTRRAQRLAGWLLRASFPACTAVPACRCLPDSLTDPRRARFRPAGFSPRLACTRTRAASKHRMQHAFRSAPCTHVALRFRRAARRGVKTPVIIS